MRDWSNTVGNKAEEFNDLVNGLYSKIEALLATDYKGGVSDTFNETVLDLKPFFTRQYETLNEFCSTINTAADNIDEKQQNAAAAAQGLGIQEVIEYGTKYGYSIY